MARKLTLAMVLAVIGLGLSAQTFTTKDNDSTVVVRQNGTGVPVQIRPLRAGVITSNETWTRTINRPAETVNVPGVGSVNVAATNNVEARWTIKGYVFVDSLITLTIEPGAVVWARPGTGANATALLIQPFAKIIADGTVSQPIIFTYEGDDVSTNTETKDDDFSLWGGLIVLGNAPTNLNGTGGNGRRRIEGVDPATAPTRGFYGGNAATGDPNHDGGIINYVSIRNTGITLIGNSELQGLTLGGVGRGTVIDHVESIYSGDDGVEIFGGTVDIKHIVCAFFNDDGIDVDQGWQGRIQFALVINGEGNSNASCEWDGDDGSSSTTNGQPYGTGILANATIIGQKASGEPGQIFSMKANSASSVVNSLIAHGTEGIRFANVAVNATRPTEGDHFFAGRLRVSANVWSDIRGVVASDTSNTTLTASAGGSATTAFNLVAGSDATIISNFNTRIADSNNIYIARPQITYLQTSNADGQSPQTTAASLNPIPSVTAAALYPTPRVLPSSFFTAANYIGAFNPATETASSNWASWTYTAQRFITGAPTPNDRPQAPLFFESYTFGPNPTSGTIFVRMQVKQSVDAQFDLINVNGQVLRTKSQYLTANGETQVVEVDANGLGNGVYFLRARNRATGDLLRTDRVVKQ